MVELKALQNGSDIRELLWIRKSNCNINRNSSSRDCGGRGSLVTGQKQSPRKAQQRLTIAIGHDSRLTAEPISKH